MTPDQLDKLLYASEGPTLDFKREQYAFAGASDKDKSELLKDILGFANGWRESEGYILIGVEEVEEGKSVVVGSNKHLPDHSLQEFVTSKTNRPIRLSYEVVEIEGKSVGVISIALQQRPFWLEKDFGKLHKNHVYVRRGSSTNLHPATTDEILRMSQSPNPQVAKLSLEFADPTNGNPLGKALNINGQFMQFPSDNELPDLSPPSVQQGALRIPNIGAGRRDINTEYYRQFALYWHRNMNFHSVQLAITNTGEVSAEDVRLEVSLPTSHDIEVLEEWETDVDFPQKYYDIINFMTRSAAQNLGNIKSINNSDGAITITKNSTCSILEVEYRKVQPGRKVFTNKFFVASRKSGTVSFAGKVFSKNLPQPVDIELSIDFEIEVIEIEPDKLLKMANNPRQKEE